MTPEDRAAQLLEKHGVTGVPVPVESIAVAEGFQVGRNRHDGPEFAFALLAVTDGKPILGINTNTHENRQRGALAHGLGHALLHGRDIVVCRAVRRPEDDGIASSPTRREEAEASAFSAALLMPAGLLAPAAIASAKALPVQQRAARDELTEALARQFGASADMALYRLVSLGLLALLAEFANTATATT